MAKCLPKVLARETALTILTLFGGLCVVVVTVLLVLPKATVVELKLLLDQVSLTVVVPGESTLGLLRPGFAVQDLQLKGADHFAAILAAPQAGRATAVPGSSSVIRLSTAAKEAAAFAPIVQLNRPVRLKLEPQGYDRVMMTLSPVRGLTAQRLGFAAAPEPGDWLCEVQPQEDLELRLRQVELEVSTERFVDPEVQLASAAASIRFLGGVRRSELGLQPVLEPEGHTVLHAIDPETGEGAESGKRLSLALPQERMLLAAGERLFHLEREPVDPDSGTLLLPNLKVVALTLFRGGDALREESFLLSGHIRFLAGEKEQIELERGFLLWVPEETEFRLKSLRMVRGDLELILWGRPASLKLGPSSELMDQLLPSAFEWLMIHRLPLILSMLGTVLTAFLGFLRLLGMEKEEP